MGTVQGNFGQSWTLPDDPQGNAWYSPYYGMPQYPAFNPIYNASTQALGPNYQAQLAAIQPDTSGLEAYKQTALRSGPSPWAKMATEKSYMDQALQADTLGKNAASNVATAQGNLAMRGGGRSGANERIQTAGNANLLQQQQQEQAAGMQNRAQVDINDESNRIAQLGQLPGMQMQQAQFQLSKAGMGEAANATDIQNQMLAAQAQNQYNLGIYKTQGEIWGAGKQANATEDSGGGSWICTAAARNTKTKYTKTEKAALLMLREYAMKKHPAAANFYLFSCRDLVKKMGKAKVNWAEVRKFVDFIIQQILKGDVEGAYIRYEAYVREAIFNYWPSCNHPIYLEVKKWA